MALAMDLLYEGSVKRVYRDCNNPNINYFQFTDDYSVFDWGKMPDQIAQKGKSLSIIGGLFFHQLSLPKSWEPLPQSKALQAFDSNFLETIFRTQTYQRLAKTGLLHHFLGWVSDAGHTISESDLPTVKSAPLMQVAALEVNRPRPFVLDHQTLYRYDGLEEHHNASFLIPLEVVFRFGMPEGSSLKKRLAQDPNYSATLGLSKMPEENILFERPVIEFFTKLEPLDRFLPLQEAFVISGLSEVQFTQLYEQTVLLALWLYDCFAQKGIALWDGKFEFAWSPEGLMLVDSIGPDELRLKVDGVHLSKEMIRQFYRGTSWEKALQTAKKQYQSHPGTDWKAYCQTELGQSPQPLVSTQKALVDNLYGSLANRVFEKSLVETSMTFEEMILALKQDKLAGVF